MVKNWAKYLKIWAKMDKVWKYFEKGQVIVCNFHTEKAARKGPVLNLLRQMELQTFWLLPFTKVKLLKCEYKSPYPRILDMSNTSSCIIFFFNQCTTKVGIFGIRLSVFTHFFF